MRKQILIIALLAIIVASVILIFIFKNYKIIEKKEFKCEGVTGFTFTYPVFKGWETKAIEKNTRLTNVFKGQECFIWINWPDSIDFEVAPKITVTKDPFLRPASMQEKEIEEAIKKASLLSASQIKKNPNGVPYNLVFDPTKYTKGYVPKKGQWTHLQFYLENFSVRIRAPQMNEHGFSIDAFNEEVIKSFRLAQEALRFGEKKAITSAFEEIPKEARGLLPKRGLVLLSGGFTSSARRAVFDVDKKTMEFGASAKLGSSPFGKLPLETKKALSDESLEEIISLANKIWENKKSFSNLPNPNADFDVTLILADNNSYRLIKSFGPPMEEVDELYMFIWKLLLENTWRYISPGAQISKAIQMLGKPDKDQNNVSYGPTVGLRMLDFEKEQASIFAKREQIWLIVVVPQEKDFPLYENDWESALGKPSARLQSIEGKNYWVNVFQSAGLAATVDESGRIILVELFEPKTDCKKEIYRAPTEFLK